MFSDLKLAVHAAPPNQLGCNVHYSTSHCTFKTFHIAKSNSSMLHKLNSHVSSSIFNLNSDFQPRFNQLFFRET